MRPASLPGSGDYSIQLETLQSPDFILRAYNLVSVHTVSSGQPDSESDGETGENINVPKEPVAIYTFPFNACQRDSQAMRMCYSQPQNTWSSWEPTLTLDSAATNNNGSALSPTEPPLQFALSRNHIGFRGVVCTSSLPITRPVASSAEDSEGNEGDMDDIDGDSGDETHQQLTPSLFPGSYFVMAGRLSQSILPPSPKVSGLWLLDPFSPQSSSDVREPTFALPTDLDGLLHRATAVCGSVALANWTGLQAAGSGYQDSTPVHSHLLATPPIMRFSRSSSLSLDNELSEVSASTAAAMNLFGFHNLHDSRGHGAGSDSD
ncbi:unnamed protein product [Rodentolepis nana]|uniref:Velvet domain-containing protein n=1 Tax=Rodentolepis nana TaxID=102285 RepID=A0A0R3TR94_RODNA|nr:unnamed protein product [Rodentolepis nana]